MKKGRDTERNGDEIPRREGDAIDRRQMLERTGRYSLAVVGVAVGGQALAGCDEDDPTICEDTCTFANDGECDDGGPGSDYSVCSYGTDCNDCGVRSGNHHGYGDAYSDSYSNGYSDEYSNSYSDYYSNSYSDYYSDYYSNYYNYSDYYSNYYYNYFSNSW